MTKKTYGQQLIDHRSKNLEMDDDIIEYRRQMEGEVLNNISHTVSQCKYSPLYQNKDFYIVVLFKVERIGVVPKTLVFARRSCPTPTYQQAVYKYHTLGDGLELLWSIPSKILYFHILRNAHVLLQDKECADITKFVLLMESEELLNWVKKENGEKKDAIIKISKENEA